MAIRPLIDDPGIGLPGYPTLSVDLKALADVAAALRQEVDRNLQPHITQLNSVYGTGVNFGAASPSENMKQARSIYHDCLVETANLLSSCVVAGELLAAAIDEIGRRYGAADAMANARATDVGKLIDQTMSTARGTDALRTAESSSIRTALDE
jgi:hypothetical protein